MIHPQELRIGNYVNHDNSTTQVTSIEFNRLHTQLFSSLNHEEVEPIELTEEWLLKLGFEKTGRNEYNNDVITYNLAYGAFIVVPVGIENGEFCMEHIKYVHQLQNLYHSITGQELTIKE